MKIQRKDIPDSSNTPILTFCRKLLQEGIEETELLIYRGDMLCLIIDIEKAAKLTVKEDPSPHFVKYRRPSFVDRP